MINVMLTGVGGQGTVLAAKVLAQAAQDRGWAVRTAETIGMAQRGGSVVSHVRIANLPGEQVHSPLIARETADLIIAFEPGEGARVLPYLSDEGTLVTATTAIPAVTSALSGDEPYRGADVIRALAEAFANVPDRLVVVPDAAILKRVGSRKPLNTVMLASAISLGVIPLTIDDLYAAIEVSVKPKFVDLNLKAIDEALA